MDQFLKSEFSQHLKRKLLSDRTIELYMGLLGIVSAHFEDFPRAEFSDPVLTKKFEKDLNNKAADFLIEHRRLYYLALVKHFCEFKYDLIIKTPDNFSEPEKKNKNVGDYSLIFDQVEAVIPKASEQNKIILNLHKFYGKRISEMLKLKAGNIKFEDNKIDWELKRGKKSSKTMTPYIYQMLKDWINKKDLLGAEDLFYPCLTTTKMKAKSKYNRFIRTLNAMEDCPEAKKLTKTHNVRRAVTTQLYLKMGLEVARAWMDHTSTDTTLRYAGELAEEKSNEEAFDIMSKISKGEGIINPRKNQNPP